jgi:tRNA(fMet)-specific endonuclease VapC
MGQTILDTSAIIKYLNNSFPAVGGDYVEDCLSNNSAQISFVTEIELQVWSPTTNAGAIQLNKAIEFVQFVEIIGIDRKIIEKTIDIRKNYRLKLPDAIIAATALVNDAVLISDNDKDFKRIPDLKYINPSDL